ncbi:helix-turn-helix transcriptional regulator [Micrococcus sp.]|uniref:helix-turn-helix transcriptional regulator n=1 Tax=Micrococcus sp. TaxID=1271 RepID=UPI002A91AD90|nr:WYL domain-containing protein [Micrococcus sp.]MDY6055406.1 WYL domain-containing protein [Micrococcus sp.]
MSPAAPRATEEPAERIISLLWLLLHEPHGYTREQIRRLVVGYEALSDAAFDKRFQRDRQVLRQVGVPLTTAGDEDDGDAVRHRVDRDSLLLRDLDLTVDERRALLRARRLWGDSPLRSEVVRAVGLLFHPSDALGGDELEGFHTLMPRVDPRLEALTRAAAEESVLRFGYRDATGALSTRTVRAWFLTLVAGRWYLTGWDTGRGAERSFRLSRMESGPTVLDPPPAAAADAPGRPVDYDQAALRARLTGRAAAEQVRVWLAPGRAQGLRVAGERAAPTGADGPAPGPGWELWRTRVGGPEAGVVEEVASFRGAALFSAAEPGWARRLHAHLSAAVDAHAGPADPSVLGVPLAAPVRRRLRTSSEDLVGRLLDIVGLANREGGIARAELEQRLGVPAAELDRDLEVLRYCGMPEREFPGFQFEVEQTDGRVRVHQASELAAPVRLTLPEAHTLLAALQSVAEMTVLPAPDRAAARSAQARIHAGLVDAGQAPSAAEDLPELRAPAAVSAHWDVVVDPGTVRRLLTAIAEREVLALRYHAVRSDALTEREVEPLAVVQEHTRLYLQGWCRRAGATRVFRVDRIGALEPTGERFAPRRGLGPWRTHPDGEGLSVLVRWDHAVRDAAEAYRPVRQATCDDGARVTELVLADVSVAAALAARHGGAVEVMGPEPVRDAVREQLVIAAGRAGATLQAR